MPDIGASRPIRFVLDGRPVAIEGESPAMTLLEWLRLRQRETGTKEGCAEGDCGACTVVLAHREADGQVRVEPCNACIRPLASVDGCGVITVAGLGGAHPVQEAMVDGHGAQCGFCTPGFVTAMAARLAQGPVADRASACVALAGNLCRCTGYRPIVDALCQASEVLYAQGATPLAGLPAWVAALPPPDPQALAFEAQGAQWFSPQRMEDIDALLAETPDAWLLAGGTDIGLWVTKQLRTPARWIYLGAVPELARIETTPEGITLGAAVSLTEGYKAWCAEYPELEPYVERFASPAIRASGTLVGNLANGSPIGDTAPVAIALGATVMLRRAGPDGRPQRRSLPLEDLYLDYRVQRREPGEWIESVWLPRRRPAQQCHAAKLSKRFEQDISAVSLGLSFDAGEHLSQVRIALGGMAGTVRRARAAEALLEGARPTQAVFEAAGRALSEDFTPMDDLRASRAYRLAAAAGLLQRFWAAQWGDRTQPTDLHRLTPVRPPAVGAR